MAPFGVFTVNRRAILGLCSILLVAGSSSAQTVSGVSGTLGHGNTVTVSGSGFGTRARQTPLIWDDVESGAFNSAWTSTTHLSPTGTQSRHQFSSRCGVVNFKNYEAGGWFQGGQNDPGPWYCQYWFKLDENFDWGNTGPTGIGSNLANVKVFRIWETGPAIEDFVVATEGWSNSLIYTASNVSGQPSDWFEGNFKQNWTKGTWHLFQFEFKDSSMGQHDGVFRMWRDGQLVVENTALMTREDYAAYKRPMIVGFYNSWGDASTDDNHFYIDDALIDNSWARVEIGNAPTYAACTHREIQILQSWADGQVSFRVNQGSFENASTAYVFVKNNSGAVSTGYPITFGGTATAGPGQPGKPTF
ncbi:MAG: hypothetical protein IPH86_12325 [bacterium]|nr:hypothetical protein [bacterium]